MIWISVGISFVVAVMALWRRIWAGLLVAAVFYAPLALYLSATPRFRWAWATLLCYPLAAYALRRKWLPWAWVSLILPLTLSLWIAATVIFQ